jgi:hypothetical protein
MSLLDWYRFYHARVAFYLANGCFPVKARQLAHEDANDAAPFTNP